MSRTRCELANNGERDPLLLARPTARFDETLLFLSGLFRRAGSPVLGGLLLASCADDGTLAARTSPVVSTGMHCVDGRWRPMSNLVLAREVDYVSLRSVAGGPHPTLKVVDAAGEPCGGARAPRLCEAEARRQSVLETDPEHSHLLITRGDTVEALNTLAQKLELLGAIDTPDEALLIIEHEHMPIGCDQSAQREATKVAARSDGYRITTQTPDACSNERFEFTVDVARDGSMHVVRKENLMPSGCAIGRRPPNLRAALRCGARASALGRYFASAARLEAASVDAFEQLLLELKLFGAPRALWEAAYAAAEDEVRHARDTAALAERFGARPQAPRLHRRRLRGKAEVALDNALEGCVQETYGAYLATLQAGVARDGQLKRVLAAIARDETRHAALSWQLAGWLEPQLDARSRQRLNAARARAIGGLGARSST